MLVELNKRFETNQPQSFVRHPQYPQDAAIKSLFEIEKSGQLPRIFYKLSFSRSRQCSHFCHIRNSKVCVMVQLGAAPDQALVSLKVVFLKTSKWRECSRVNSTN